MLKVFKENEIDTLLSEDRIILFRDKYIYDVTNFTDHPGTYNIFLKRNGTDISKDYNFHKNKQIFKKYLIGVRKRNSYCNIM